MMDLDTRQRAMLQEMGVHVWLPQAPADATAAAPVEVAPAAVTRAVPAVPTPERAPATAVPTPEQASANALQLSDLDWPALAQAASACAACGLCASRRCSTLLAPAIAPEQACDWMVVGDAPDEAEDLEANPFAGDDGVLLDNMLRALGVRRVNLHPEAMAVAGAGATSATSATPAQRFYVTNVVKCRPAHGQIPQAADLAQCGAYLAREIALVRPRVILAMGRFALQALLGGVPELAGQPLGKLRGTVHHYAGIPVVVTYHPKQLMRKGADNARGKAQAWADLCLAAASAATTNGYPHIAHPTN